MDFQNEFDSAAKGMDTIVSTQLSSSLNWSNIPGGLIKASSSAAGYLWGYNSNNVVYICQLPCTGNWTAVNLTKFKISSIQDIVTDNVNVYILITDTAGKNLLLINSASNQGVWNMITVPFKATKIFSTGTYIWAQDPSNNKQKCPKPCTTANWIADPENKITITSASTNSLYGKDGMGTAYKTDEKLQSPWKPISGLTGLKLSSVIGDSDKEALFGVDTASKAYKCEGNCFSKDQVQPLDTGGYMPLNMTTNDGNLYMTTTTSGQVGNIFSRPSKPDFYKITSNIDPFLKKKIGVVTSVDKEYESQTKVMVVNKQVTAVVDFVKKFFNFDTVSAKKDISEASAYKDKIRDSQEQIDKLSSVEPLLQKIIILLLVVLVVYLLGTFLGTIVHVIALVVLIAGCGYIYYSTKS